MGWIKRLFNSWRKKKPVEVIPRVEPVVIPTPVQHKPWEGRTPSTPPRPKPAPTPPAYRDRSYTPQVAQSTTVVHRDDTDYVTPLVVAAVLFSDSGNDNNRCDNTYDSPSSSYSDSSPSSCD